MHTRSSQSTIDLKDDKCFLCNEPGRPEGLHNASTHNIDAKVHKCAIALEDTALLAKLEPGDMIVLEAKYHWKCLVNLYNRARALNRATCVKTTRPIYIGLHLLNYSRGHKKLPISFSFQVLI